MNPTAEDILNKYKAMNWDHDYAENGILSFADAKEAMEEYSLLKSKEAASEAWEVALRNERLRMDYLSGREVSDRDRFRSHEMDRITIEQRSSKSLVKQWGLGGAMEPCLF